MKESKSNICFQCEEQEELLPNNTICVYCDELNRKNDFLSGNIEINKNNLHLYYKFISNEDLEKYSLILNDVFMDSYIFIYTTENLKLLLCCESIRYRINILSNFTS